MLIVDTGPLYAAAATRDPYHRRCTELLASAQRPLVVPALAVTEVAYLLAERVGPHGEVAFARALAGGELQVEPVHAGDWARIHELVTTYADLALGIVDASIVALAERLNITTIATLDQRHFTVVKPKHVASFTLLPGA